MGDHNFVCTPRGAVRGRARWGLQPGTSENAAVNVGTWCTWNWSIIAEERSWKKGAQFWDWKLNKSDNRLDLGVQAFFGLWQFTLFFRLWLKIMLFSPYNPNYNHNTIYFIFQVLSYLAAEFSFLVWEQMGLRVEPGLMQRARPRIITQTLTALEGVVLGFLCGA